MKISLYFILIFATNSACAQQIFSVYGGINTNRAFASPLHFTNNCKNKQGSNFGFMYNEKKDSTTYTQLGIEYNYTPIYLNIYGGKKSTTRIESNYLIQKLNLNATIFKQVSSKKQHQFYIGSGVSINYLFKTISTGKYEYYGRRNTVVKYTLNERDNSLGKVNLGLCIAFKYEYWFNTKTAVLLSNQNMLLTNLMGVFIFSNNLNLGISKIINAE